MGRIAPLALVLLAGGAGCGIDVIDCIDLGGGCGPEQITLRAPTVADNVQAIHAAVGGRYDLTVEGGVGDVGLDGADHLEVEAIEDAHLVLRGRDEGEDRLEVRRGESALATHWVRVFALARVVLLPRELAFSQAASATPFALLAGQETELYARLVSADGDRLVDQDLIVEGEGVTPTATRWDAFRVTAERGFFVDLVTARRADGFTVPVVSTIDDVIPVVDGDALDPTAIPADTFLALVCFAGVSAGLPVAGLAFEIEGQGASVPVNPSLPAGGCVHVSQPQDGQTVTVTTTGLERTFVLHTI